MLINFYYFSYILSKQTCTNFRDVNCFSRGFFSLENKLNEKNSLNGFFRLLNTYESIGKDIGLD